MNINRSIFAYLLTLYFTAYMVYRWTKTPNPDPILVEKLAQSLSQQSNPSQMWGLVASLLVQRRIYTYEEAKKFFRPSLNDLHDPFLMKDMLQAVKRIHQAIEQEEKILVYGDYDVDGTTSVALMYLFLKEIYSDVTYYIPDRYIEGYGVSFQGVDYAHDNGISLVIALDCGTKAIQQIAYAREKGIDFVVCDHHRPSQELPVAKAILNPKQNDCLYPYKELCGCGIGFKLVQALIKTLHLPDEMAYKYLDLVSLAIAADIVPITDENRILVFYGLKKIENQPLAGIEYMLRNVKRPIDVNDLVFAIAPRINAAGRIKHGEYAVKLLTESNPNELDQLYNKIEAFNTERKQLDEEITREAIAQIIQNEEESQYTSVVFDKNWHKGVLGIVASRLTETYYRPTLVFTQSSDKLVASARSIKGFDIYEALEKCSDYIEQFGGHKYAAGLSLLPSNYPAFKRQFETVVAQSIPQNLLSSEICIDTEISLEDITNNFHYLLKHFAPFGPKNMNPTFLTHNVIAKNYKQVGKNKEHIRMEISNISQKNNINAIGFGLGEKIHLLNLEKPFSIVYTINKNNWQGNTSIQLQIKDIKIEPDFD